MLTVVQDRYELVTSVDVVASQSEKILSNFKYLLPDTTSTYEKEILNSCELEIKSLNLNVSPMRLYSLHFHVPRKLFNKNRSKIANIESNLSLKGKVIFRWFPGCSLMSVSILPK